MGADGAQPTMTDRKRRTARPRTEHPNPLAHAADASRKRDAPESKSPLPKSPKLKPIPGSLSVLDDSGRPLWLGDLTLVATHVQDDVVFAAGTITRDGKACGHARVQVPVTMFAVVKSGRPPNSQKHIAVYLAFMLALARDGGRMDAAEELVRAYFKYEDARAVRKIVKKIRDRLKERLGVDPEFITFDIATSGGASATSDEVRRNFQDGLALLFDSPRISHGPESTVIIDGMAWIWNGEMGQLAQQQICQLRGKVLKGELLPSKKAGPKIVATINSGP